jgi:Fe-S cluster assembly scaffold protein SufB
MTTVERPDLEGLGRYKFGWADPDVAGATARRGLSREVVEEISGLKNEPQWMLDMRLKGLALFEKKPMPTWGADLSGIDFDSIKYFVRSTEKQAASWEELPADIKNTYDRLGIPEAEKQRLIAGVAAQYECLAADTRVWTANRGQIPIKAVQPGDRVFAYDERQGRLLVARVRAAAQTDTRQTYQVRVGGRTIRATDNHPFLALRDERRPGRERARRHRRWAPLRELRVGDMVAVPRELPAHGSPVELPAATGIRSPRMSSPDLLWLLGLFVADGLAYGAGRTHRVQLAIPETDAELRGEVTRVVRTLFGLTAIAGDDSRLVVNSKALVDWLWLLGFSGTASAQRVPDWMYATRVEERLAFLGGWVDAAGYVDPTPDASVLLTCASQPLLSQAAELAQLTGLRVGGPWESSRPYRHAPERTQFGYRLRLSGDLERLGCRTPGRLERFARHRYQHSDTAARGASSRGECDASLGFARITAIEPYEVEPVWDLEVDGPHNFVAEGLLVHNSEVVYHKIREDLESQGVLFLDTDTGLREHEDIFREYFASVIPPGDNKFAALNTAVWSGGSFIYVPKGVQVDIPLQAYFRINTENMGQFERTLIIVDEGAYVHYVEGCTAPVYSSDSLHSAVVEIVVKRDARCRYTTIQNWSNNVYNLVTKRAQAQAGATMEWVDGNLGCLAEGSTVTTPGGVKAIELLVPGDEVLSYDERSRRLVFRTVTAKRYSGEQPVREVSVGERRLRVTDNHPFFSWAYDPDAPRKLGGYRLAYVRADRLEHALIPVTSIDYGQPHKLARPDRETTFTGSDHYAEGYAASRDRRERLAFPEATTDDLMWVFGAFIGAGSIEVKDSASGGLRWAKVVFSIPEKDRARARLEAVLDGLLPGVSATRRADGVAITWHSVELAELLLRNGLSGTARTKRVPAWVRDVPAAQRLSFLAGVLDTAGCAAKARRGFCIKSVNRQLLGDLAEIATTLGLTAHLSTELDGERQVTVVGRTTTAHGAHRLDLPADPRLSAVVSPALRAAAARQPALLRPQYRRVGRSSVHLPEALEAAKAAVSEPLGTVRTWDIEVDGTGNFVSQGFIVHNSKVTMKYPAVWLLGEHAKGETLSVAFAGEGQHQDAGAKMVHAAPHTSSTIISKSVARGGGRTSYRGLVQVQPRADAARSTVKCDALLVDNVSRSDTYPYVDVRAENVTMGHEATVSKISDDQLFYLMSRGLTEDEAMAMIVRGFIEPIARELPMEYALELNRLIELQMEGAVG